MRNIVLVSIVGVLSILLALSQIFLKRFLVFYFSLPGGFFNRISPSLTSYLPWVTFVSFLICVVLWIWILPKVQLSLTYPMVSLSYVVMLFLAYFLEGEPIYWLNVIGVLLIVGGVILLAVGR